VLARKYDDRNQDVKKAFEKVPYLNSSLFEPTEIEQVTLFISNLKDDKTIPVISSTVLKNDQGKKRTGTITTLEYLFDFLNAYDFTSEGSEEIQEDNKSLINASVLGLIFEKINGYKDGSFFTPGFITMYMCRETIRKAVVQKFNETKKWNCNDIEELYDKIEDRKEANKIVNSIKICDPAVGSGHFLVSALNEMIAVKNDLKILQDRDGKRLKEYQVEVVNDELIVTDEEGELFEYNPTNSSTGSLIRSESQRIQETLFHEKQTIIENCLFGVDINPNSVKICRLRLWIELLKNAYYKNSTELETLPNIDINIKCGNSLVSRFAIDADLSQALKKSKWTIDSYRIAVDTYRNAESKEQKREMERLISDIKSDFRSEISLNDPKLKKQRKLSGDLFQMTQQTQLFEMSKKEKADWNKKVTQLTQESKKLETEIEEIKANKIFENAFEWRFEFPEVLNDDGDFVGFDVVIGNPPYGVKLSESEKKYYASNFNISKSILDTYILFIEQGYKILKENFLITYIIPSTWIYMTNYKDFRKDLLNTYHLFKIIHFKNQIFTDATVETSIIYGIKSEVFVESEIEYFINESEKILERKLFNQLEILNNDNVAFQDNMGTNNILFSKISQAPKLIDISKITCGLTPYRKDKGRPPQSEEVAKGRLFDAKFKKDSTYRQYVMGRDFYRYTFQIIEERWISYGDWLAEPRRSAPFDNNKKIIIRQTADKIIAHIDENKFLNLKNVHNLTIINDCCSYEYILAILNSKLLNWWYTQLIPEQGRIFAEVKVVNLNKLPIKLVVNQQEIIAKVFEILSVKKQNSSANTAELESQIDQLVYQLYELTEEEIKIVEGV
jgi:type I restriction-modification system DNA methylase subunit